MKILCNSETWSIFWDSYTHAIQKAKEKILTEACPNEKNLSSKRDEKFQ